MKKVFLLQAVLVAAAMAFVQASVYADDPPPPPNQGKAHLGVDTRTTDYVPEDYGFAFLENVTRNGYPQTDTCKTFPKTDVQEQNPLPPIDGVASPENPEPILTLLGTDKVTFIGRTADCYYIVTGVLATSGGDGGEGYPPCWSSEFDTGNEDESFPPHFVVTINDRYRSDDDSFIVGGPSRVWVELQNKSNASQVVYFRLVQQPYPSNGLGAVSYSDDVYQVSPDEPVSVDVTGETEGEVIVGARETDANGNFLASPPVKNATTHGTVIKTLSIVPDAGQIGVTGDMVASNKGVHGEKHYVSPKKDSDFVLLKAVNYTGTVDDFNTNYTWSPVPAVDTDVQPGDTADKIKVKRDAAKKITITLTPTVAGAAVKLNVWIISSDVAITATRAVHYVFDRGKNGGILITGGYDFSHTISPVSIFTKADDIPALYGPHTPPPDVPKTDTGVANKGTGVLAGGASCRWDNSRQLKSSIISPNGVQFGETAYPNYPSDPSCGNDDPWCTDEINLPYQATGKGPIGILWGWDDPQRAFANSQGNVGDTYEVDLHFIEFTRVNLGNKWFVISDHPLHWQFIWKVKKVERKVNGRTFRFWVDDGSNIATSND